MTAASQFASRVFFWAGVYGILVLAPLYFLEDQFNQQFPPPINHPEHFYGFIGVALAWQLAFLLISRDVIRYRMFMLPAVAEKVLFGASVLALFTQGRVGSATLAAAAADQVLGVLFVLSFYLTGRQADQGRCDPDC